MTADSTTTIPLSECKRGEVYRLHSRNLALGVFDGIDGFVGIRSKFDSRFLDVEYHWDNGPPYGTVRPRALLGVTASPNMVLAPRLPGTLDESTNRMIHFDLDSVPNVWRYVDTQEIAVGVHPVTLYNKELFEFLNALLKEHHVSDE